MKFVLSGDWHLTDRVPRYRSESDFLAVIKKKLEFIFRLADDCISESGYDVPILQPGDMFDSPRTNYSVLQMLCSFLSFRTPVFGCLGQHDTFFHHLSLKNTPSGFMQALLPTEIKVTPTLDRIHIATQDVTVHLASWGVPLPDMNEWPGGFDTTCRNILVMHDMVTHGGPSWVGQEGNTEATSFLEAYPIFDLVVTGDNHKSFLAEVDDRYLVNCGSLLRTTVDQVNHRPRVYVWDSKTRNLDRHYIPVEPGPAVFRMEEASKAKQRKEELQAFVETLLVGQSFSSNFKQNLLKLLDEYEDDDKAIVTDIIKEVVQHGERTD